MKQARCCLADRQVSLSLVQFVKRSLIKEAKAALAYRQQCLGLWREIHVGKGVSV